MPSVRTHRVVALWSSVVCALAFASSASASIIVTPTGAPKSTPFGCRASTARVMLGSSLTAEPYVANKDTTPCATDSSSVENADIPSQKNDAVTVGPAGAYTFSAFDPTFKTAPGATAVASVEGVTIPSSSGNVYIAGPIQATASYACVNDQLVSSAQSTLNVLYVAGAKQTVPNTAPFTIPLGSGSYITTNQVTRTGNSLTIDLVHVHLGSGADIVLGEAKVTQSIANPCANTKGLPPVLEICSPGTTLNIAKQFCYVKDCDGRAIIVSRPFRGPSGGVVLPLCKARKKYKSPCLFGPGPKFALVATRQGGRVLGTLFSDRILALGAYEYVAGLGGNDCLDGQSHNQRIYDGNGRERVYAHAYSRIGIGNGNSRIVASAGHNHITAGNGNVSVTARGGANRIDLGLGKSRISPGPGANRVFTPSTFAQVTCGSGSRDTVYLRRRAMLYAQAHGCNRIIHLV